MISFNYKNYSFEIILNINSSASISSKLKVEWSSTSITDKEINESKNWLINAAQYIMEIAADPNYSQKNGNKIYDIVKDCLNREI